MKERPILFSGPMVRALLAGTKTQTRRVVKDTGLYAIDEAVHGAETAKRERAALGSQCPHGAIDDQLWVRETWGEFRRQPGEPVYRADYEHALGASNPWRPSIHMPRKYSRITLRITNVRVERLTTITETDAIAEGVEPLIDPRGTAWKSYEVIHAGRHKRQLHPHAAVPNRSPVTSYRELWEAINGAGSWAANPWVWIIAFERVTGAAPE